MNEEVSKVEEAPTGVEAKTPPTLTPEQMLNIRNHLHNSILAEYQKLQSSIQQLPFPEISFAECFRFLDTGMLWLKEAIYFAPFSMKSSHKPAAETEVKEEKVDPEKKTEAA